ncbi:MULTISPECIES: RNA polymerase sigma-70 factor [unclassified Rhizobacter]|uniref:RNA polymerase sigma-70 factor n=1 Tax=unclassified Rhizobacter TaxID=2640088 RepID=UPI0006F7209D|nr:MULTISPECIES: RNA polymerase sigma-70 factor [unclassified Rhizobacter]KQU67161.1 RNA polymerase subunit sigma-24 [Rhizobacter sp. Root29]KQV98128.1 RNA polymerase subunit sigma-24 [Rhizobacter sp. Root1238]KRB02026.1 RNA polymerase subunit sigma-24 [Rhizobacter sp. Root16D2]
MDTASLTFNGLRPRLRGIAYRMLGSLAEAEEVVQDTWLRWHEADYVARDDPTGWLVTVATRLSINRLRAAKVQREHYAGLWLPEPVLTDSPDSPEQMLERADNLSVAFLLMLERLTPEARAAFLLREVFDADYDELASTIGKSEAACRQLVHRARVQLREEQPRFEVSPDTHRRLLGRFAQALTGGDFSALKAMLAEDAELIGDGGGKVPSFGRPMLGGQRIAQLLFSANLRWKDELRVELALINGEWGLLRFFNGVLESAQSCETDGERIVRIHVQRNPDKLVRVARAFGGC